MNEEKRLQRRQRLMDNKAYQTMDGLTRYMDRYYLDALIGVIPGWGDAISCVPQKEPRAWLFLTKNLYVFLKVALKWIYTTMANALSIQMKYQNSSFIQTIR